MSPITQMGFFHGPGPAVVAISKTAGPAQDSLNKTVYLFSAQAIGAAAPNREVLVAIVLAGTIASVKIGGNTAAIVGSAVGTGNSVQFWMAAVPTGTTADVEVTLSSAGNACAIVVYRVTGRGSTFDTKTSTADPASVSLNIPANGVGVAIATMNNTSGCTWTGLTETQDSLFGGDNRYSSAAQAFTTTQTGRTVTADFVGGGTNAMSAISFGP